MYKLVYRLLIIAGFILNIFNVATAQECKDMKHKCEGYGSPYKYSGQSKGGTFELGQVSQFKMVTFAGFKYSVSLCAEKQLDGIFFRIKEDSENGKVLYDGQKDDDGYNWKQFYIEKSQYLIIEVVAPDKDPSKELDYEDTFGCVAVTIEYYKVGKKGF
jgi:hypothetical protein